MTLRSAVTLNLFALFFVAVSSAVYAEPAKQMLDNAVLKRNSGENTAPTDLEQSTFLNLAAEADKELHSNQLDKVPSTLIALTKCADKESEPETKARMLAEIHRIDAEMAILKGKWDEAAKELLIVKSYSAEFAGEDTTGHFDDLLTLIRQKSGKLSVGPKNIPDIDKEYVVKTEMRALQVAVEEYARHHGSKYPAKVEQLQKGYLDKFGSRFTNPFTKKEEWPQLASNEETPQETVIGKGRVFYRPVENGDGYVIFGGGFDGKPIVDEKGVPLVLRSEAAAKEPSFNAIGKHPHIE